MVLRKLKLLLKAPIPSLFLKAIVFGLILGLINYSYSFLWLLAYFVYCLYIYLSFFKNKKNELFFSFVIFMVLSFFSSLYIEAGYLNFLAIFFLSLIFLIFLGIKSFVFNHPKIYSSIFYYFLVFFGSAYFSSGLLISRFFGKIILAFIFIFLITREFLDFVGGGFDKRKKVYALAISFLAVQILWVSSLLSIGFLNPAVLTLIFIIGSTDIFLNLFSGNFSKKAIIKNILFFVVFSFLVLILPLVV